MRARLLVRTTTLTTTTQTTTTLNTTAPAPGATATTGATTDARVRRLSALSVRRVVEPETALPWGTLGTGQVLADELLSIADLDHDLGPDARARLSREEAAAMLASGVRFEAILDAAFSLQVAGAADLADPRLVYMLHEIAEETRHQRAFLRLIDELGPQAHDPFARGVAGRIRSRIARSLLDRPALLLVMVLAGEEIPDLLQKLASEHPRTDPLLAAVNRYHRQEEARHLSFARAVLPEAWSVAGSAERFRVRHLAPRMIELLHDSMVHPGVYATVGLPPMRTWRAVTRSPSRRAIRHHAIRPILATLLDAGILRRGRIPRGWRRCCGVDRHGHPFPDDPPLPGAPRAS